MSKDLFDLQKTACLSSVDLSRKGSIDDPIVDLVAFINEKPNYFTTSSCSGRIIAVDNDRDGSIRKQGCKWILTSHDTITVQELKDKLHAVEGNAVFKFEPFVMHVQCRTLEDAQLMLSSGVASGYRNSGISVGNKGKFITAIRSTHSMEVPLSCDGQLLVSDQYLEFLVGIANSKMKDNLEKIGRFFQTLKTSLSDSALSRKEKRNKTKEDKQTEKSKTKAACRDRSTVDVRDVTLSDSDTMEDLVECAIFTCDLDT